MVQATSMPRPCGTARASVCAQVPRTLTALVGCLPLQGEKDRSKDKGKDKLKDKVGPMGPPTSGEGGAKGGDKSWVGKHPWRPFDR